MCLGEWIGGLFRSVTAGRVQFGGLEWSSPWPDRPTVGYRIDSRWNRPWWDDVHHAPSDLLKRVERNSHITIPARFTRYSGGIPRLPPVRSPAALEYFRTTIRASVRDISRRCRSGNPVFVGLSARKKAECAVAQVSRAAHPACASVVRGGGGVGGEPFSGAVRRWLTGGEWRRVTCAGVPPVHRRELSTWDATVAGTADVPASLRP